MSDENETQPSTPTGGASRRRQASSTYTTIGPQYETRRITVALGLEAHNDRLSQDYRIPSGLQRLLPDITINSDSSASYTSRAQRVNFIITVVTDKTQYKQALETAGIHVVYMGHARYGRGPCFGDDPSPGEQWGNGTNTTGMWRMGYPYLAVPVSEILSHQYTVDPVLADGSRPTRRDCHPDVRGRYGRLRAFTLDQLAPAQPPQSRSPLADYVINSALLPDATYWGYDTPYHGRRTRFIVLNAGWENTATDPMDLNATDLQCRVFCHFGCSTFKHNYRILRFRKQWQRTNTDRFAYWTTNPSGQQTTVYWLYHLLNYRRRNAFQSWRPSLRYALGRTNNSLRRLGLRYRLI